MNWPIFLVGIVAGWIIEWVVDLLFWRKRQKQWVAAESEYRAELDEVRLELDDQKAQAVQAGVVKADLASAQAAADVLRRQLAAAEAERDRLGAQLTDADALHSQLATAEAERDRLAKQLAGATVDRQRLADHFGKLAGLAVAAPAAAGAALVAMSRGEQVDLDQLHSASLRAGSQEAGDDLTMIEGVGPKIQELLYQNDIHTFAELADCDVERLRAILLGGGPSFRMADPETWPRQARLAAAHDWPRLQALNEQLTGGVRRPPQPAREDDLTIIEGIGPQIEASLKKHGIRTFAQLARTDVQRLQEILAEDGPAFKLAAPAVASWPQQARLAADGAWDQFHALKDTLKAGRSDAGQPAPEPGPAAADVDQFAPEPGPAAEDAGEPGLQPGLGEA